MRIRTIAVLVGLLAVLAGLVVLGMGTAGPDTGGSLSELWVSDTARDNQVNHHAVGVGPEGDVVVAPVAALPNSGINMTPTSCTLARLAPDSGTVVWRTRMPPSDCFTHALTEPAIEDVDEDGDLEVVVSTTEGALVVRDAETGREQFRTPLETYGYGRPTVADVLSAQGPELVTSDIRGNVLVAYGNGTVAWRHQLNQTTDRDPSVWESPVVGDVDGDDEPEVLFGTNRGPVLLDRHGEVEWFQRADATYLTAANVDDDASMEVFTAGTESVRAFDGATGDVEWERNLDGNPRIHAVAVTDSTSTLFVGRVGGRISALDAETGETIWETDVSTSDDAISPPPVLGDVDGDGTSEVVAVVNDGTVAVLDSSSGVERAAYQREVPIWTFATTADLDDDGDDEVLVRYGDGRVVALDFSAA